MTRTPISPNARLNSAVMKRSDSLGSTEGTGTFMVSGDRVDLVRDDGRPIRGGADARGFDPASHRPNIAACTAP